MSTILNTMSNLSNEINKKKKKDKKDSFWMVFVLGIMFFIGGVFYSINNVVKIGVSIKYLQPTFLNAGVLYLLGITFLIMSYYFYKDKNKPF